MSDLTTSDPTTSDTDTTSDFTAHGEPPSEPTPTASPPPTQPPPNTAQSTPAASPHGPRLQIRQQWARPAIMLFCSSLFVTGILYAYYPSLPVPRIQSATMVDFGDFRHPQSGSVGEMPGRVTHALVDRAGEGGTLRLGLLLRHVNRERVAGWAKRLGGANTTGVDEVAKRDEDEAMDEGNEQAVLSTEIFQEFNIPLASAFGLGAASKGRNSGNGILSGLSRAKVTAQPVFMDRIYGTVEYLAVEKHGVLDGWPRLCIMYSVVQSEDISYNAQVYSLGDVHLAAPSTPTCNASFFTAWPPTPPSCVGPGFSRYSTADVRLPGTLSFDDFAYSWSGRIVYSRRLDDAAFRWESVKEAGLSGMAHSSKGPQHDESVASYTPLVLYELYNPDVKDGSTTILRIRARELENVVDFEIMLFFRAPNSTAWTRDTLFKRHIPIRTGGEEFVVNEQQLYFVKYPVIGTSAHVKSLSFVFLDTIFTLDYVGDDPVSSQPHPEDASAKTSASPGQQPSQLVSIGSAVLTILLRALFGPLHVPPTPRTPPVAASANSVPPVGPKRAEHGFILSKRVIYEMDSSDLRIRSISVDSTRKTLVVRNLEGDIVVFRRDIKRRSLRPRPVEPAQPLPQHQTGPRVYIYVWPIWPIANILFDGVALLVELATLFFDGWDVSPPASGVWYDGDQQVPPSMGNLMGGDAGGETLEGANAMFSDWKLDRMWPAARGFGFDLGERRPVAQVLLERSRIPAEALESRDDQGHAGQSEKMSKYDDSRKRNDPFLLMVYNDGLLLLFDLEREYTGSYVMGIIRSKWDMFIAMWSVIALFVTNEIRRQR